MHKIVARLRQSLEVSDERVYFSAERSQKRYVCGALFHEGYLCGKRLWHLLYLRQLVPTVLAEKCINEKLKRLLAVAPLDDDEPNSLEQRLGVSARLDPWQRDIHKGPQRLK